MDITLTEKCLYLLLVNFVDIDPIKIHVKTCYMLQKKITCMGSTTKLFFFKLAHPTTDSASAATSVR